MEPMNVKMVEVSVHIAKDNPNVIQVVNHHVCDLDISSLAGRIFLSTLCGLYALQLGLLIITIISAIGLRKISTIKWTIYTTIFFTVVGGLCVWLLYGDNIGVIIVAVSILTIINTTMNLIWIIFSLFLTL